MTLDEALKCLGAKRVIWIDDIFNDTPGALAKLLIEHAEITAMFDAGQMIGALALANDDPQEATLRMAEILTGMPPAERIGVRDTFHRKRQEVQGDDDHELSVDIVESTCRILAIAPEDRWPFDGAEQKVQAVNEQGDESVAYMVDLREAADDVRGLAILKVLGGMHSKATAFILTNEASVEREADHERFLHDRLGSEDAIIVPLCVISKERLKVGIPSGDDQLAEALRVAVKRAGLRRSVHEVLNRARDEVARSCASAADNLLRISPEHLDAHVVEVGYREGVSELHVIERALTAHIGLGLRKMFGHDDNVRMSNDRLRRLRAIPLNMKLTELDETLTSFHKAEVWEDADLLNAANAPIACGEVFETDPDEKATAAGNAKMFVLLAQPCDIALRPEGKRGVETGVLIPIKSLDDPGAKNSEKDYRLPVLMDGKMFVCSLREAVPVRLSILDLASYRKDGRVRIDTSSESAAGLLPGLERAHGVRTEPLRALMTMARKAGESARDEATQEGLKQGKISEAEEKARKPVLDAAQEELQLLLAAPDAYKHVRRGVYEPASSTKENGVTTKMPERITWRLRRIGRIRMPYAADLLDRYVNSVNKPAFEVDYIERGQKYAGPSGQARRAPAG